MHAHPAPRPADESDDLARLLVRAERAVRTRRARDVAAPWITAARLADAVAFFALLLPWTFTTTAITPGYRVSTGLTTVAVVVIVLRQLVRTVVLASTDRAARTALLTVELGGLVGVMAVAAGPTTVQGVVENGGAHVGPAAFGLGLLVGTLAAVRAAGRIHDAIGDVDLLAGLHRPTAADVRFRLERALDAAGAPRRPAVPVVLAVGALLVAAGGLLGPWQVLHSGAVRAVTGSTDLVWLGYQLSETVVLRWVLVVAIVAVTVCAAVRPLRPAFTPVLALAGLGIVGSTGQAFHALDAGAGLGVAGDARVTVLAGVVCVLPVVPILRRTVPRPGAVVVVALAAAVGVGLLAPLPAAPSAGPTTTYGQRIAQFHPRWQPLDIARRMHGRFGNAEYTSVLPDVDGTVWLNERLSPTLSVFYRFDGHRFIPVASVRSSTRDLQVQTAAVRHGRALIRTEYRGNLPNVTTTVRIVDLDRPVVEVSPSGGSAGQLTVLRTADRAGRTFYTVTAATDGSVVLSRYRLAAQEAVRYRITAQDAYSGHRWRLGRPQRSMDVYAQTYGPDGLAITYRTGRRPALVDDTAGRGERVIVGGVTDPHCGLSRDPLSSYLGSPPPVAVDAARRVWMVWLDPSTSFQSTRLVVLGRDRVLRAVPSLPDRSVSSVAAAADGSLVLATGVFQHSTVYRAKAADLAARAVPLPRPSAACGSENGRRPTVTGAGARLLPGTLPLAPEASGRWSAVVDARGTVLTATSHEDPDSRAESTTLQRQRPGGGVETIGRTAGTALGLAADGRGGAFWFASRSTNADPDQVTARFIWHVSASGAARPVARTALREGRVDFPLGAVDLHDGSFVWATVWARTWSRTTADGRTSAGAPVHLDVRENGSGGVVRDDENRLRRMGRSGPGQILLDDQRGGPVSVRGAAAGRQPAGRAAQSYPQTKVDYAVTSSGALLVLDGDLGRLDGDGMTLLATRETAPPILRTELTVIGDHALWVTTDGRVATVRVP